MGIETLIRPAKIAYEEFKAQEPNGIDKLIFPEMDEDTGSAVLIDRLIESPFAVSYREKNGQSQILNYTPGQGQLLDVPRASMKTPVDEELRDVVVSGVDAVASWDQHKNKRTRDIVKKHMAAHNLTKWKQAIDFLRTGIFYAKGPDGTDLDLSVDYDRDTDNTLTYDFTAGGASFAIAVGEILDQMDAQGADLDNVVLLCGADWLTEFGSDSDVQTLLQSNMANQLIQQQMLPPQIQGTKGLRLIAQYRNPGLIAPVWIASFNPGVQYVPYKGASAEAWVPATEAVAFSLNSPRYYVKRGVDALDAGGNVIRTVGDMVLDTFHEDDPIVDYFRSQTRHLMLPGNVDHTVKSTGTFT